MTKLKYTWQLPINGRLPTGSTNSITTVVEVASGKGHQHERHLQHQNTAYDFSVKLSSCICRPTDSSCPGCWLIICDT